MWNAGNSRTLIYSMAADRKGTVYVAADGKILRYQAATENRLARSNTPTAISFT